MFKNYCKKNKPKCGVLIGINYSDCDEEMHLNGCINDIESVKDTLVGIFDYKDEEITMLRDDSHLQNEKPTGINILNALSKAVQSSHMYSEIWIHYSRIK